MYKAVNYNSAIHHRRTIRLKGYDYSKPGMYFITICCHNHELRFGHIDNNQMHLNKFGIIAQNEWYKLPERFRNLQLDAFQIMPNHIHAIIIITEPTVGATLAVAPTTHDGQTVAPVDDGQTVAPVDDGQTVAPVDDGQTVAPVDDGQTVAPVDDGQTVAPVDGFGAGASPAPTDGVGNIVGAYKSLVAFECLKICNSENKQMGKLWQRNYYEHIIRNHKSYQIIEQYITNNPTKWNKDKFSPKS
jgi:putative transposase